jgi:hypothetical protein
MADDWEVQRLLRKAIAAMPVTIESGALDPKTSATDRLKWVELAIKVFRGPGDRPATDDDLENERKAARILKAVVPALEKICNQHHSERIRNTAALYLRFIASEVRGGN